MSDYLPLNNIYCMNCEEGMRYLKSDSINLTITSPPYDNIRNYNGYNVNFEVVIEELFRVTKSGGVVVWVVGDKTEIGESCSSFKQALLFKEKGFYLYDTMIFQKKNPTPLNHGRYQQCFDFMFIFSKGKPEVFNPIMVTCKTAGNYQSKNKYRHTAEDTLSPLHKKGTTKSYKIRNNIWEYAVGGKKDKTIINRINSAPFPTSLVIDHIVSWSNKGDIVLDPFMGSGTTPIIAFLLDRQYIAFEISIKYFNHANREINRIINTKSSDNNLSSFISKIKKFDEERILM
ncbi:MAG: site-specific DNA-methyltransferase [Sedimentibacter saalensis]|uniref:DNA-methyltransferase n=1 Tax=Sedimentibacter saalensis TaxID=130788 RepID=UPI0031581A77